MMPHDKIGVHDHSIPEVHRDELAAEGQVRPRRHLREWRT